MFPWLLLLPDALAAEHFAGQAFYLGDLHVHTGASGDGASADLGQCVEGPRCGSTERLVEIARGNGLDFLSVTDHVNGPPVGRPDPFNEVFQRVLEAHDPEGGFVTIPGAEAHAILSEEEPLGHYNLYLFGDRAQLEPFRFEDAHFACGDREIDRCEVLAEFMAQVTARFGPALLIPHHPAGATPMPVDWGCTAEAFTPAVEIYSEHGNSLSMDDPFDAPWSGRVEASTVHSAISPSAYGLRLGFFASTDTHDTMAGDVCSFTTDGSGQHPKFGGGLAVVVLDEGEGFDREAIYRALVERRTYATSGPLIPAVVSYSSGGEWLGGLGDELLLEAGEPLTVEVSIPEVLAPSVLAAEVVTLDAVLRMGEEGGGVWSLTLGDAPEVFYVQLRVDGEAWYGEEGCEDGGEDAEERIWLSPSWVVSEEEGVVWPVMGEVDEGWGEECEEADPGCGCGSSGEAGWLVLPLLLGLGRRRRGHRRG
jgi:MYXO-CTERM domain-containing protein